jgi:hypothetical protein
MHSFFSGQMTNHGRAWRHVFARDLSVGMLRGPRPVVKSFQVNANLVR